ncbi:MAG TPA: YlmH/Sll1252 family protein [Bacillota bacterium]|nr:YlmH/Sll1252 family protein [Bacillota bacterium]
MGIYQHFRDEEHPFIDQVFSWLELVQRTYERRLTDFLDPREQEIVQSIIGENNSDFNWQFFGGSKASERQRAIIAPFYEEITNNCFQLALLEGTYNDKFMSITHQDVMGTFLSLGIDRNKLGDIVIANGVFQFFTDDTIVPYLQTNFISVKRARITLQRKSLSDRLEPNEQWKTFENVVPSLRLDAVIRSLFNISRKQATTLVKRGHVKVNFKVVDELAHTLNEGDLLSVRGKGRGKFIEINGRTRKNNLKIKTARLQK